MKGDTLDLIITFFVEVRFGCCLGCISSIFIMKNDYTKFQHLKLSIERPHGQLFYNIQYQWYYLDIQPGIGIAIWIIFDINIIEASM